MALTAKQETFVREYLVDLNATQAAIRAGYAAKDADVQGPRLLGNVGIAAAIEKAMDERSARTEITADKVLAELAKIGFADIRRAVRWYSQTNVAAIDTDADMAALAGEGELRFAVANQVELVSSDEIDDETAAAISEIGQSSTGALKVKFHDKRAALVDIGRHLGMFKERVELTGKDGGPMQINQVEDDADAFTRSITGLVARRGAGSEAGDTQH
jgi:phage terminase small subunit